MNEDPIKWGVSSKVPILCSSHFSWHKRSKLCKRIKIFFWHHHQRTNILDQKTFSPISANNLRHWSECRFFGFFWRKRNVIDEWFCIDWQLKAFYWRMIFHRRTSTPVFSKLCLEKLRVRFKNCGVEIRLSSFSSVLFNVKSIVLFKEPKANLCEKVDFLFRFSQPDMSVQE